MGDTRMETYYGFVSTSEDALALFEACRLGYKQRVPRRLSDAERAAIRSGSVFVWEEHESGMKRWTDGRSWSPSRVQGCFLTYHEWEGRRRAQRHPSQHLLHGFNLSMLPSSMNIQGMPTQPIPMGIARYGHFTGGPTKAGSTQVQYGFPKENGMLKKALSIRTNDGKKLHIIAYYSKEDHAQRRLLTPTTDPNFPKLAVPPNLYPDMTPESMYGAGHSMAAANTTASPTKEAGYSSRNPNSDPQQPTYDDEDDGGGGNGSANASGDEKLGGRRGLHASAPLPMDVDVESHQHPGNMHSSPDSPHNPHPQLQHPHLPPTRLALPPHHSNYQYSTAASGVGGGVGGGGNSASTAAGPLYRARVKSLVDDEYSTEGSGIGPPGSAPASLMAVGQLSISRPAPEHQLINGHPHRHQSPQHYRPRQVTSSSASSSSLSISAGAAAVGTRPSSNSFSCGTQYHSHHTQPLVGPSTSSSSAPASTMRRSTASNVSLTGETATTPTTMAAAATANSILSESTQARVHNDPLPARTARSGKYLGLGGPLGLGNAGAARKSTPLRAATTAAVLSRNPYLSASSHRGPGAHSHPSSSPLHVDYGQDYSTPHAIDIPEKSQRSMSFRSSPKMTLLLSPVHPPPLSAGHSQTHPLPHPGHPINLAGIRGDVREGPRRLPSISASLRNDSPPTSTCSPGGLGIIHPGISAIRTTSNQSSSLLPSPLPTPTQSLSLGFDAERGSSPQRQNYPDSLSLLASAADRAQVRHVSTSNRPGNAGHHPYSRGYKRGPTMRSVSLRQSEDIRQLDVLNQSLKLK